MVNVCLGSRQNLVQYRPAWRSLVIGPKFTLIFLFLFLHFSYEAKLMVGTWNRSDNLDWLFDRVSYYLRVYFKDHFALLQSSKSIIFIIYKFNINFFFSCIIDLYLRRVIKNYCAYWFMQVYMNVYIYLPQFVPYLS